MANYYETRYRHASNATMTSTGFNDRWHHIDDRLDALEDHMDDEHNPHAVTAADVGASLAAHTHTVSEQFTIAVSGELTGGAQGAKPPIMEAGTITAVTATVETPSGLGDITIDLQKSGDHGANWATILSTKITIEQSAYSSAQAAIQPVIADGALLVNDRLRVVVDAVGSGAASICVSAKISRSIVVA